MCLAFTAGAQALSASKHHAAEEAQALVANITALYIYIYISDIPAQIYLAFTAGAQALSASKHHAAQAAQELAANIIEIYTYIYTYCNC